MGGTATGWTVTEAWSAAEMRALEARDDMRSARQDCRTTLIARSRDEHCRAFEHAGPEIGERFVGLVERIGCRRCDDADLGSDAQEFDSILSREVGDRCDLTFFPQQPIGEARDVAHVDPRSEETATFAEGVQGPRGEVADRRE